MQKPFKTTLSNGLRVILLESHAAPVVSWNLWANVGSVNESDDEAGICHLIEHMIFKGTGRRPVGEIARQVEAAGGDINAYTSFDETVFYINMSSRELEIGLDILADAASDPLFDETELAREKEVVVEEISRAEDNPSQMVSQDLFSRAYAIHPYRRPIAGSRETVRGISRRHLLEFYKRWYVGSNLIFVGTGDFKTEAVLPKIESLFSKIPAGGPPSVEIPSEPAQTAGRQVTRGMVAEGRYLDISFPIPDLKHPDVPALDILAHILGGGPSSRLELSVKEKQQLVSAISASPYTPRYPGLFIIGAILREKKLRETLQSIWEEIEKLQSGPPSTVEFARARENLRSARIYEKQTVEAMARKLGFFEGIAGDIAFEEEYYRRLSETTPEDIQKVARGYFSPARLTVSFCHPQGETWTIPPPSPSRKALVKKESGEIHYFRLPSGVRLLIRENRLLPLVSIRSASLGGIRRENRRTNGVSHLVSELLTKGTTHRTSRELAEETEHLSGHLDGYVGRNLIGVHGTFLSEKITQGLGLFFDILFHPAFPEEEISKEIRHTLTAIRNEEDSLPHVAMKKFMAALYPNHPYGLSLLGTPKTVLSLRRRDLANFYEESIRPDNLVITVAGDVDAQELKERITEKIGSWKKKGGRPAAPRLPTPPKEPILITTKRKKLQAHIVYGFLGTTVRHPDRYPLEVLNNVLAGQGGRLFLELRDRQGLAYAISSSTQEGIEPGYFTVYMGTDPKNLQRSMEGIRQELQKVRELPVTEEEIRRSKRFIIGNYELDLQKNESVAALLAFDEIYGVGREELFRYPEKIERVSREDLLRVTRKYLRPEASVLSVIKP